jgi:plasmid stabilization system protein ParE
MGSKKREALKVVYSARAIRQLNEIWNWNFERYGEAHADGYIEFLQTCIDALAKYPTRGKLIESRPGVRYYVMSRKAKGHAHIAIYSAAEKSLNVSHIFHSAQNWQRKIESD